MSQSEYSATSGAMAAAYDIKIGRLGYHRNASNSQAYRDAYDAAAKAAIGSK